LPGGVSCSHGLLSRSFPAVRFKAIESQVSWGSGRFERGEMLKTESIMWPSETHVFQWLNLLSRTDLTPLIVDQKNRREAIGSGRVRGERAIFGTKLDAIQFFAGVLDVNEVAQLR